MKNIRKIITTTLAAAGIALALTGCGSSDKFEGEWATSTDFQDDQYLFFRKNVIGPDIPTYDTVSIKKNGNSYLVTYTTYSYKAEKKNDYKRGDGITYRYVHKRDSIMDPYVKDHVKIVQDAPDGQPATYETKTGTTDYKFILKKDNSVENGAGIVENKGNSLVVKRGGWPVMQCDYVEKGDSLNISLNGARALEFKRSKADGLQVYIQKTEDKIKEFIQADADQVKEKIKTVGTEGFLCLPGKIEFDTSVADKK